MEKQKDQNRPVTPPNIGTAPTVHATHVETHRTTPAGSPLPPGTTIEDRAVEEKVRIESSRGKEGFGRHFGSPPQPVREAEYVTTASVPTEGEGAKTIEGVAERGPDGTVRVHRKERWWRRFRRPSGRGILKALLVVGALALMFLLAALFRDRYAVVPKTIQVPAKCANPIVRSIAAQPDKNGRYGMTVECDAPTGTIAVPSSALLK